MEKVLEMLAYMFKEIFAIVDKIYTHFNAWSLIIGGFIIYTVYRLLLIPVIGGLAGSGASDVVQHIRESGSSNNQPRAVSGLEKGKRKNG